MNCPAVDYRIKTAVVEDIRSHLLSCDEAFLARLRQRVDIAAYSRKIFDRSVTFEAWVCRSLVGLLAVYLNDAAGRSGFITSVSVLTNFCGQGIASEMLTRSARSAREHGFTGLRLEVPLENERAIRLYRKAGFVEELQRRGNLTMIMNLLSNRRGV